jgi:hypothetical protein
MTAEYHWGRRLLLILTLSLAKERIKDYEKAVFRSLLQASRLRFAPCGIYNRVSGIGINYQGRDCQAESLIYDRYPFEMRKKMHQMIVPSPPVGEG